MVFRETDQLWIYAVLGENIAKDKNLIIIDWMTKSLKKLIPA